VVYATTVIHGRVDNSYGWGVALTALFWFGHFIPTAYQLWLELRRNQDRTFRNRLKYMLIVLALLLLGNVTNATPLGVFPVDLLLASLAALLISLSISRYQVLEIGHVLRRLFSLLFVIVMYVLLVSGTLYLLANLSHEMLLPGSILAALSTAGLLLLYQPFRAWVISFIERVFLPERYNVQALIYAISQAGNRLRLPGELGADVLRELTRTLYVPHAQLFIKHESQPIYHGIAGLSAAQNSQAPTFKTDSPLMHELASYRLAMHVDRLMELPRLRALWIGEWDSLRLLQAEVLVPVLVADDLIGFLILGARTGGAPYTRQELQQTLPLLANQISIALANSRLYEQEQRRANQLAQSNADLRQAQAALSDSAERIRREAAHAEALVRIANRLNAQLDLDTILSAVCEETARALSAPAAGVSLYTEKSNTLDIVAGQGLPEAFLARQISMPYAAYNRCAGATGTVIIDSKTSPSCELMAPALCDDYAIHTIVMTSMLREGAVVGCLTAYALEQPRHFSEDELDLLKGIAAQAAQAIMNARLYDDAQRRLRNVEALREIDASITGSVDLFITLRVILDKVKTQLGVDAADFLLLDVHSNTLNYAESAGFRTPPIRRISVTEDSDCAAAVRNRQMVLFPNLNERNGGRCEATLSGDTFTGYVGVPLIANDQVKGVLEVFQRAPLDAGKEWVSFLNALGTQAAIAIDNSELFTNLQRTNQELSQAYESTLEGWARALELRDQETQGHARRVVSMTVRLGRLLGVPEEDLIHLRRGALLHDIGKMAIADAILLKPGQLTPEEWALMKLHPVHAYRMLSPIAFLRRALDIPYAHHEKWDGTGYPLGLKGEDIPRWARIFAIVDVWDALRSKRPYRHSWQDDEVRAYLKEQSGRQFDPRIVDAFMAIPNAEWEPMNERLPEGIV
jgi:GAF domain-containing protein